MRTRVVLRSGLSFRVGFDQEPAEVRYQRVDLVSFVAPPGPHRRVKGIRRLEPADLDRCAETCGQVDTQTIWPQDIGERGVLSKIQRGKTYGAGVDVGGNYPIDSHRGARSRIVGITWVQVVRQLVP